MKWIVVAALMGSAVLTTQADAKGCIKGALVGGVAGHFAGHHGLLGAAAGCAIGHHRASQQQQRDQPSDPQPTTTQTQ